MAQTTARGWFPGKAGRVPHRLLAIHGLQPQSSVGLGERLQCHNAMPGKVSEKSGSQSDLIASGPSGQTLFTLDQAARKGLA